MGVSPCTIRAVSIGSGLGGHLMQSNVQGWIQTGLTLIALVAGFFASWVSLTNRVEEVRGKVSALQSEINAEMNARRDGDVYLEKLIRWDRESRYDEGRRVPPPPKPPDFNDGSIPVPKAGG